MPLLTVKRYRSLRWLEHIITLWVFWKFLRKIRRLGPAKVVQNLIGVVLSWARAMPGLGGLINKELKKETDKLKEKYLGDGDANANVTVPVSGRAPQAVLKLMKSLKAQDEQGSNAGQRWGGVYHAIGDTKLERLQSDVFHEYNSTNCLYPKIFPSVRKYEAEIISMAVKLLNGSEAVGLLTSGGTESILIAIFGYKQWALEKGITEPEIVCCRSAHAALDKACHYFGLRLVKLDPDAKFQLNPVQVEKAITGNTIAVYASAPSFSHGVIDPIRALAKITKRHGIGLHVDNCLGGWYLSFLKQMPEHKAAIPDFDFTVDGVTTISIDVHKYAFASKGASVVAFVNNEFRRRTYHPVTDGLTMYVTTTMQGSRSGALVASAWATIMHMGYDGYYQAFSQLHDMFLAIKAAVAEIKGIRVPCDATLAIVPVCSDEAGINIFTVAGCMETRGWNVFTSRLPPTLGFCVGQQHLAVLPDGTPIWKQWLEDLKDSVQEVRENPSMQIEGDAAVYGAAEAYPPEIISEVMRSYCDTILTVKPLDSSS